MLIRTERPEDAAAIETITTEAFRNAPHAGGNEARIVAALRAAGALTLSLVAVDEAGEPIGHIAFSPVEIGGRHDRWFALGPVSVRPDLQGQGIGGELVRTGLAHLEGLGAKGCVLLGEPDYYGRFGFVNGSALTYLGYVTPHLQWLVLAGQVPEGAVTFHPAFDVA
jgi:predicted N-acetyltransferase YhbS